MKKVLAVVLAGGEGKRLSVLAHDRAKPAVPFGGKYRIIDFVLSNCINSGINTVAVIPQYNPRSLARHIGVGKPWDLDRVAGGITLLYPFVSTNGEMHWYKGTANAVYHNLQFITDSRVDEVLVLSGDHVYTMHYEEMIKFHRQQGAAITIGVTEVPWYETNRFGIMLLDGNKKVVAFEEKPSQPKSNLASMGIYVFNKDILFNVLEEAHQRGLQDFGSEVIPDAIDRYQIYGYKYEGYWRDVGTVEAYWQANMDLVVDLPPFNLYDPESGVKTLSVDMPPVKVGPRAQINRSLVSNGCIINGSVVSSVLSPHVYVEEGAHVIDSIIFHDTTIAQGAVVQRSIIDKECYIGSGCWIGCGEDYTPNKDEPDYLNSGITVIGIAARLPQGLRVGRNCKIDPGVKESDFSTLSIPSGSSVGGKEVLRA
ncbi:MAG: glucose-1-phosphate adenylyltransferase [Chloroflexi bacterium RBG_13_51_36]|nr:MAG: glucose-1-phosphate adenylyltransferase [Chloroflexi bacterium RBG_13_51_36]